MKDNNKLYNDIVINLDLTNTWKGEFILVGILNRILQCNEDIQDKEGYAPNLETENFENDLHHIANHIKIGDSGLLSGYLYTNVDDTRENSTIKFVSAITNHKNISNNDKTNSPIFTY